MNKRDLNRLKKLLTQQLKELIDKGDCSLEGLRTSNDSLPDIVDRASTLMERDLSHQVCGRQKHLKEQLEQSLHDIEAGDYGICKRCEEDIGIKRLMTNPVAQFCIDCKTEMENREKVAGVNY